MTRVWIAFSAALLAPVATSPLWAQAVLPVHFPAGASSTAVNGSITGRQYKDYRVGLRAGQMFTVNMRTLAGSPYFNILEPGSNDVAIFVGSSSGANFEARTRMNGNYTIRVYQMRADERRGKEASYRLSIAATGSAAGSHQNAPAHRSTDALVPGTPYHAVAPVHCRVDASQQWGQCQAGVVRRPGSATVHLDTFDGGERTILFRDGRAVSSDASQPIHVTRRSDISVITIGAYEVYEIPDSLPFGG
jgi:hypothetical protein